MTNKTPVSLTKYSAHQKKSNGSVVLPINIEVRLYPRLVSFEEEAYTNRNFKNNLALIF